MVACARLITRPGSLPTDGAMALSNATACTPLDSALVQTARIGGHLMRNVVAATRAIGAITRDARATHWPAALLRHDRRLPGGIRRYRGRIEVLNYPIPPHEDDLSPMSAGPLQAHLIAPQVLTRPRRRHILPTGQFAVVLAAYCGHGRHHPDHIGSPAAPIVAS